MDKKIFLAVILAFISSFPLLHKGLPPTHDGEYHVIRFFEFNKTLLDGNLYPRWAPDLNNGFGVPLFNYVYPLPNYVASFFHFFNFSFIDAFKFNMFLAMIIGAIFFYLWAKEFWGKWGALVSASFYSFSPYHLLDVYIRGSVGEVWALALFPGFLWSVTKFIKEKNSLFVPISSIFLALMIFSHNILALMFITFSVFYCFFIFRKSENKKQTFYKLIVIYLLGIGLSAIFWFPALLEKQYVRGLEVYDYSTNFPEFYQLIIPSWGSGFSGGFGDQLSFQVGIANLSVIFLSILLLLKNKIKELKKLTYFFLVSFFIVFYLILSISKSLWQIVPLMNYFQFPWRFLSLEVIISSFLAGYVAFHSKNKIILVLLILFPVLLGIGYANFAYYHQRNDGYYTSRSNFIDGTNSPGNAFNTLWAQDFKKQKERIILSVGRISNVHIESAKYTFHTSSLEESNALVNTAYFPGWTVYIDKKLFSVNRNPNGAFDFAIPKGDHNVTVQFEDTLIRKISILITGVSFLIILLNILRFVKIKR